MLDTVLFVEYLVAIVAFLAVLVYSLTTWERTRDRRAVAAVVFHVAETSLLVVMYLMSRPSFDPFGTIMQPHFDLLLPIISLMLSGMVFVDCRSTVRRYEPEAIV